ncbi:MAG: 4-(cytidine 5'-diphospho)-2-C-methyl-D-erythritol kinase [Micrococcales bacterium]|nr:4-(cytidine 5'-diphospho)-2-C-methyl-D-erythritol kinase [Micrococcales bacterium]MCL2668641.1 4-(cytidine 5'-diphospho)-2-C-methyl-D-erythritol kinase [Micrococcales bacterium]
MTSALSVPTDWVRVRAPGKVNLSLRAAAPGPDGYHPLVTVFQAVSVYEDVVATAADDITVSMTGTGDQIVPTDSSNLAVRAAQLLASRAGISDGVHLHIDKRVPVAGGMAGGSADAAAALVATDELWGTGASREDLLDLGRQLGADVPFALMGHTAVGTGRGDMLTPAMVVGEFHWALAFAEHGLSTPRVFSALDDLRGDEVPESDPDSDIELMQALRTGDPHALGEALHNDLQPAALHLLPDLGRTVQTARDAGALGVVVCGSGPTVAALGRNRAHAQVVAASLTLAGVARQVVTATGPVPGARLLV